MHILSLISLGLVLVFQFCLFWDFSSNIWMLEPNSNCQIFSFLHARIRPRQIDQLANFIIMTMSPQDVIRQPWQSASHLPVGHCICTVSCLDSHCSSILMLSKVLCANIDLTVHLYLYHTHTHMHAHTHFEPVLPVYSKLRGLVLF